jgi:gliding motility-associated lipoprotein GldB
MNRYFVLLLVLSIFFSCRPDTKKVLDDSEISVNVQIERFERLFYATTAETLPELKLKYPYLFPEQDHDSVWMQRISDTTELELFRRTERVFGNMEQEKVSIAKLFNGVSHYNTGFVPPKIITLISNRDYQSRVMYVDSLLFISLDLYLGSEDEMYVEFPDYLANQFEPNMLTVDIASAIVAQQIRLPRSRIFLNSMIAEGKKLVLMQHYLPEKTDGELIKYTDEQLEWVQTNEGEIWKYFVENKMIFSTDLTLATRFIEEAPFSKFYLDIDKESPGRVGSWLGWQIVKAYMKNTDATLADLINSSAEEIFNTSKYKPKK